MRTATYKQAYDEFIATTGLESAPENIVAKRFNTFFNARLRKIWRAARWHDVVETNAVWVCYGGAIPEVDGLSLDEIETLALYDNDPRIGWKRRYIPYIFDNNNINIGENLVSTFRETSTESWTYDDNKHTMTVNFDGSSLQLSGRLYAQSWCFTDRVPTVVKGDCVLIKTDGSFECYVCTADKVDSFSNLLEDFILIPDVPFKKTAWLRYRPCEPIFSHEDMDKTFPYAFKTYIVEGARASWIASENRQGEAAAVENVAQAALEEELIRLESNPNIIY